MRHFGCPHDRNASRSRAGAGSREPAERAECDAGGVDPESDAGLFGPQSVTWRVHADPMMGVGGLRGLMLQSLHPEAVSVVHRYSNFRAHPWHRLQRTADYIRITTYGTTEEAERAGAALCRLHDSIPGASQPHLLLWVHCCAVDSFFAAARRGGASLTDADADAYVFEQRTSARLVGLDPAKVPDDWASLQAYFTSVRPLLRCTDAAREALRFVHLPPMPLWVQLATPARPAWVGVAGVGFALLPRWARRMYGAPGLPTTDMAASASARGLRLALVAAEPLRARAVALMQSPT